MGLNFTVLLQYWSQNMQESRGDGDQACGYRVFLAYV